MSRSTTGGNSARSTPVAIVGVGESSFENTPGISSLALSAEAATNAIADAGVDRIEIDGLLTGYTLVESHFMYATVLAEYLGMHPRYHATMVNGGATPCEMIRHAAAAVTVGQCNYCLVVYGDNRGSGYARAAGLQVLADIRDHPEFEYPYGLPAPGPEAMMARRYMHEFGVSREQLAEVAVAARTNAARNPKALKRDPITVDDVLSSKMIADPLRGLDCCLVSNFGGAVVVTTDERARELDATPVYLLGSASCHSHKYVSQAESLTEFGVRGAAEAAFAEAGVTPADIDVAGVYDGFTITVLLNLEELGFCERGGAGTFVTEEGITGDGKLPVNTHGGMLSCAHGGILHVTEVANQLRGACGERQVEGATLGLVHGDGASQSAHSILVLGSELR
jgi:acetyl-CoA acetyltransferase